MSPIPNKLYITINTSIPGYQKIQYKPFMTIPDISKDDKTIYFNPMIKYSKNKIDEVQENFRKKQFFNKGLFNSLINHINEKEATTLLQATRNGYIDNNIKLTLNTIFPENSVLYINKKPYTIADVQWSSGNWKIDTKITSTNFDSSIKDPYLYKNVVKDEIITGKKQLKLLPSVLLYGANYIGPKNHTTTLGTQVSSEPTTSTSAPVVSNTTGSTMVVPTTSTSTNVVPITTGSTTVIPNTSTSAPVVPNTKGSTMVVPNSSTDLTSQKPPLLNEELLRIEKTKLKEELIVDENKKSLQPLVIQPVENFKTSKTSDKLRKVFSETNFYNLINQVYISSSKEVKNIIQKSLLQTTRIDISQDAYNLSVSGIKTIENEGRGNCFFIAIADGINYHNYYNQNNRIISGRYGIGTNLYTQLYLRSIVSYYIQNWDNLNNFIINIAPLTANNLNDLFVQKINKIKHILREQGKTDDLNKEQYLIISNDIFNNHYNFLVKNIETIPIDINEYNRPFRVIEKPEINRYILYSNFSINDIVIYALCSELKLNIISLENIITQDGNLTIQFPFANFKQNISDWNKFLFLYYYKNHYELITFTENMNLKKIYNSVNIIDMKGIERKKIIFNNNNNITELPPIYILFSIFGSVFTSILNEKDKNNFTFKKEIMFTIQDIINNVLYNESSYLINFYPNFKSYFPNSKIRLPYKDVRIEKSNLIEDMKGGALPRYTYVSPQPTKMVKKNKDNDDSQLAYYITIDMELKPGTSLSAEEIKNLKCNRKWNSIRKAYSEVIGKPYVIKPVYDKTNANSKTLKNEENKIKNKTKKIK